MVNPDDPMYDLFCKRIKRFTRYNLINSKDSTIGNSLAMGNPGFCKTSGNRREIELRWELNHKIFCLYDAGRGDMCYFMFPSNDNYWKIPKLERGKIISAKSYPTILHYPITKNLGDKIPNPGVPFTIPVSDITEDDLVSMVGGSSRDTIKGIFYYMQKHVNDDTTAEDYVNIMGAALKKVEDTDGIKPSHFGVKKLKTDFFLPMLNEGLLSSKNASTALDLKPIIEDREHISVLVLKHCPKYLWGFLVHYFLNHISILLGGFGKEKPVRQKTTIVLNEVADLLSSDEDVGSSSYAINKLISKIAKQSRTFNIFMLLDTQLPQELPTLKETFKRIYVYNSSTSSVQKAMEIMGISTRSGELTNDDLMLIPRLARGWYYLFDRDYGVSIHKLQWCRSRTYKDGENFYDIYDKVFGKGAYYSIKDKLKELQLESKKSEDAWETRRSIINNRVQEKKFTKKKKLVEEEFDEEVESEEEFEEKIEEDELQNSDDINKEINIVDIKEEPKVESTEETLTDYDLLKKIIKTL